MIDSVTTNALLSAVNQNEARKINAANKHVESMVQREQDTVNAIQNETKRRNMVAKSVVGLDPIVLSGQIDTYV